MDETARLQNTLQAGPRIQRGQHVLDAGREVMPDVQARGDAAISLVKKLAEVMKAIERVPKRGHNDFHHYDYATEADIVATVRKELADRHIMLIPSILDEQREQVGEKGEWLTILVMEFEFIDGESGGSIRKLWRGYGSDKSDKGGYKGITGAEKYFVLKTFLIPTGDDPERTDRATTRVNRKITPAPPETVVDARTGAEVPAKARPPAPEGYRYIDSYVCDSGGWHRLTFLRGDASGGSFLYKTRLERVGEIARQAYQDGIPVRCEGRPNAKTKGEWILDKIHVWKPGGETSDGDVTVHLASEIL